MVKTNPKSQTKKEIDKHFFSCVARRTRAKSDLYITKVAEEFYKAKKSDFRGFDGDDDNEFEAKCGGSSDVDAAAISEEDDTDVVEIGFEEMRLDVKEKKRECAFDMVSDDDDSSDGWLEQKVVHVTEEEKDEIFGEEEDNDDDDDDVVEICRDDMRFDLKKKTNSGLESVLKNASKSHYYETGESSSVLNTKNVNNRGGFSLSDANFCLSSSTNDSSSSTDDDSDYRVDVFSLEPESDDKSDSSTEEEHNYDEEEERPLKKKRFEAAPKRASVKTRVSDEILIEDEVKPEPVTSDECIIVEKMESVKLDEACSNYLNVDDDDDDETGVNVKFDIGVSGGYEKTEVEVGEADSDIEIIDESLVEIVEFNNIGDAETENVDTEKRKTGKEKVDETVGSCNNININGEGGLNVENDLVQIEQVDVDMKKVGAEKNIEGDKLNETVGSCSNNNNNINDECGLNVEIGVVRVEQVDLQTKKVGVEYKIESEKLDETLGSCNKNNSGNVEIGVLPSYEKTETEMVVETEESVIEKKIQKMSSVDVNGGKGSVQNIGCNENINLTEKNLEFGPRKRNVGKMSESTEIRESGSYQKAPKTCVTVERKKRAKNPGVGANGESKNGAVHKEEKRSEQIDSRAAAAQTIVFRSPNVSRSQIVCGLKSSNTGYLELETNDSKPATTNDLKSSYVDNCSLEHEVIDSGAPEARRDVKSSNDACELLLNAILMNGQNGIEDKLFNSEYHTVNLANQDNVLRPDQLKFTFGVPQQIPVEKTPDELELESLWSELDYALMGENEMDWVSHHKEGNENSDECNSEYCCSNTDHELRLDEEIGLICIRCSYIKVEIKYNLPPKVYQPPKSTRLSSKKSALDEEFLDDLEGLQLQTSGGKASSSSCNRSEGTVWDIIPGIKSTMYKHQQEGFEFIWKNLEGTLSLDQLKQSQSKVGGCIISHAPGTGKTRLTIMFLQTYLEIFPNSRPVIIAPANMLLTWEEEFSKWGVSIPFHNLNNLDQSSAKDDLARINMADVNQRGNQSKDFLRLAKLLLWSKRKGILGISYSLYEKLVGDDKKGVSVQRDGKLFRKILLEYPGLLVLDEGHIPRNERSRIWLALTKVDTQRRIILSGTPFQNNIVELYNILCLVRPEFANQIPRSLKKFCQTRFFTPKRKVGDTESSVPTDKPADRAIEELKVIIAPFVHVHKGSILKESLPGLKDCVVVLNPANEIQKKIVDTIVCVKNALEYEHVLALTTVHPSLVLKTSHVIHHQESGTLLREIRLSPNEGCKTSFVMELVQLSGAMNEKVLVFSQFLQPLKLIKEQLSSVMNWTEGKEILVMQGNLNPERRQYIINVFNEPDSEAKVLLASTKACSEGINLVGASRVVLLDVVWNPSVERQAISRAYRLGQKKVVHTYHLIMLGTAEWDKFCKQSEKDRLSELVFSSSEVNEKEKICLGSEDRILEKMISRENLYGLIAKVIYQPKETKLIETFI